MSTWPYRGVRVDVVNWTSGDITIGYGVATPGSDEQTYDVPAWHTETLKRLSKFEAESGDSSMTLIMAFTCQTAGWHDGLLFANPRGVALPYVRPMLARDSLSSWVQDGVYQWKSFDAGDVGTFYHGDIEVVRLPDSTDYKEFVSRIYGADSPEEG
jgi:hypothetical protein